MSEIKPSINQNKDAGMALVLICMIINYFAANYLWLVIATAILVITMAAPSMLSPYAKVWYRSALFMGTYMSKIILTIVFYAVVTPVGFVRRLLGKDNLRLKEFKKGRESVMDERNIIYREEDIVKPF